LSSLQLHTSFIWAPYDTNNFISLRRVKYRLASYDHFRIPHIEKYANQLEWKEGTLEEENSKEDLAQQASKKLAKEVDLEYCGQVLSLPCTQLGVAASSSIAPPQAAQTTTQEAGTEKAKGIEQ